MERDYKYSEDRSVLPTPTFRDNLVFAGALARVVPLAVCLGVKLCLEPRDGVLFALLNANRSGR